MPTRILLISCASCGSDSNVMTLLQLLRKTAKSYKNFLPVTGLFDSFKGFRWSSKGFSMVFPWMMVNGRDTSLATIVIFFSRSCHHLVCGLIGANQYLYFVCNFSDVNVFGIGSRETHSTIHSLHTLYCTNTTVLLHYWHWYCQPNCMTVYVLVSVYVCVCDPQDFMCDNQKWIGKSA